MESQVDLSKCTISYLFNEFVKIKASWWKLLVLSHVLPVIFDDFVSFFHDFFIQLLVLALVQMLLPLVY
jgi:hypothetical protein